MARSAPVVVMERLTDVISVVILSLTGLVLMPAHVIAALAVALTLVVAALMFFASRQSLNLVKLPILSRWRESFHESQEGFKQLTTTRVMVIGVTIGVGAWFAEGLALWVILKGIGPGTVLSEALPIYAAATLIGAVTFLPGGMIGTEGSMLALLQQSGVAKLPALVGTVLVRLVTLWFAVAIGLMALVTLRLIRIDIGDTSRGN